MVFKFIHPDAQSVWNNQEIKHRFSRYKGIIDGTKIARYLVAKTLECNFDENAPLEQLEKLLTEKSNEFKELLLVPIEIIKSREIVKNSYIALAETIANNYLEKCNFCERKCGKNRLLDEVGYCQIPKDSYISSVFLHHGEESVLVPSGTIFFQGCNFGCVFCQNYDISQSWKGKRNIKDIAHVTNKKELANLAEKLQAKGAMNINYVGGDPIPNLHTIIGSLNYQTSNICQLWNSNFYLTDKALSLIIDFFDFWLPDFKYGNNECGEKYSGIKNYFTIISRNHKRIYDDGSGEIIIRHLVMPNHVECCSKPILEFIAKVIPNCVVNIMGQYRFEYKAYECEEINRRPTSEEMYDVKSYAEKLGILFKPVS